MSGVSGSGKTTLAKAIASALDAVEVSRDPLMSVLVEGGFPAQGDKERGLADVGTLGYRLQDTILDEQLAMGRSVVLECVASMAIRNRWRATAARHGVTLLLVETVCSDPRTQRARFEARPRRDYAHFEPTWENVEQGMAGYRRHPEFQVVVDAVNPVEHNVGVVRDVITSGRRPPLDQEVVLLAARAEQGDPDLDPLSAQLALAADDGDPGSALAWVAAEQTGADAGQLIAQVNEVAAVLTAGGEGVAMHAMASVLPRAAAPSPDGIHLNKVLETRSGHSFVCSALWVAVGRRLGFDADLLAVPGPGLIRLGDRYAMPALGRFDMDEAEARDAATAVLANAPMSVAVEDFFHRLTTRDILLTLRALALRLNVSTGAATTARIQALSQSPN